MPALIAQHRERNAALLGDLPVGSRGIGRNRHDVDRLRPCFFGGVEVGVGVADGGSAAR